MTSAPVAAAAAAPAVSNNHIYLMLIDEPVLQWRHFTFFDLVPVKDIHDLASPPEIFKVRLYQRLFNNNLSNLPSRMLLRYLQSQRHLQVY
jgi:hypothetical protein